MPNEDERRLLTRLLKQGVQLPNLLAHSEGTWAEVAPARTGPVVRADRGRKAQRAVELDSNRQKKSPAPASRMTVAREGFAWPEQSRMQPPAPEVDQAARRGKRWRRRILGLGRDGNHHPNLKRQAHKPLSAGTSEHVLHSAVIRSCLTAQRLRIHMSV